MIDDSGITVKLNLPYRSQKMIKKMYGKNLSFEIAYGRRAYKMISECYGCNNELDQRQD